MFQRIARSFAARLNFYLLGSITLLFIIAFGIFYYYITKSIEQTTYKRIDVLAEHTNLRVARILRSVEKIPDNMGWLITKYIDSPDSLQAITHKIMETNNEIYGCVIAFEPGYFPGQTDYIAACSHIKDDSLISFELNESPYNTYRDQDWYRLTLAQDVPRWSMPNRHARAFDVITSTYSVPLHDKNGRQAGVFSISLSIKWLGTLIDSIKPYTNSYAIVINKNGDYILPRGENMSYFKKTIFEAAVNAKDTSFIRIAHQIISGENGQAIFYDNNVKSYIFYAPIAGTEWFMAAVCPYNDIYKELHTFNIIVAVSFIIFLFLIYLIGSTTISKVAKPLKKFSHAVRLIADGNFNSSLPTVDSKDEMRDLHDSFCELQEKLSNYIDNLEKTSIAKEKIESELRIAHHIQMGMLPKNFPPFPGHEEIDLYAVLYPARQVGGDLYDFFISDNLLYFVIGDVSGKGVPASLMMAVTISQLRSLSSGQPSPALITNTLNNCITLQNETGLFVTFFIGVLDLNNGEMKYCNAGHTPPIITSPDHSVSFLEVCADLPLGIVENHQYTEHTHYFETGSGILLYTDGVTDTENPQGEFYGKERFLQTIEINQRLHPREFLDNIVLDIKQFRQECIRTDDVAMLTIIYGEEWNVKK